MGFQNTYRQDTDRKTTFKTQQIKLFGSLLKMHVSAAHRTPNSPN